MKFTLHTGHLHCGLNWRNRNNLQISVNNEHIKCHLQGLKWEFCFEELNLRDLRYVQHIMLQSSRLQTQKYWRLFWSFASKIWVTKYSAFREEWQARRRRRTMCRSAKSSKLPSTIASTSPSTVASTLSSTVASTLSSPSTVAAMSSSTVSSTSSSAVAAPASSLLESIRSHLLICHHCHNHNHHHHNNHCQHQPDYNNDNLCAGSVLQLPALFALQWAGCQQHLRTGKHFLIMMIMRMMTMIMMIMMTMIA